MNHQRGILRYGPPDSGKTFLAMKIFELCRRATLKIVKGPELKNRFIGESEAAIKNMFKEAIVDDKLNGPRSKLHIIIIDELDAMAPRRDGGNSEFSNSLVNQFLSMMDGPGSTNSFLIIGTTNQIELIDPAFKRGGRFGMRLEVDNPDQESRRDMLDVILQRPKDNYKLHSDVDIEELAIKMEGCAASAIRELLARAYSCAFARNGHSDLDLKFRREDFLIAIDEIQCIRKATEEEQQLQAAALGSRAISVANSDTKLQEAMTRLETIGNKLQVTQLVLFALVCLMVIFFLTRG